MRIRGVSLATGVPEPTLRAWERRYGIPTPDRTASGYRMYGARDVQQVRAMKALCEQGVPAAEAARSVLARAEEPPSRASVADRDPYASSLRGILEAVSRFDDRALATELQKLLFLGDVSAILDRVVTPALHRIGELWHEGELSVAQEHLASHQLGTLLRDLLRLSPGAESRSRVLLACFAEDDHELGLLATALRFSELGLRPIFLGAKTPPAAVRTATVALSPLLVALSVTVSPARARAVELVAEYALACSPLPWIVGGAGARDLEDLVERHGGRVVALGALPALVAATLAKAHAHAGKET